MYEVQTLFNGQTWENCWTDESGKPSVFATWLEAQQEIDQHLQDCFDAVEAGDMIDAPHATDFRIVKL